MQVKMEITFKQYKIKLFLDLLRYSGHRVHTNVLIKRPRYSKPYYALHNKVLDLLYIFLETQRATLPHDFAQTLGTK